MDGVGVETDCNRLKTGFVSSCSFLSATCNPVPSMFNRGRVNRDDIVGNCMAGFTRRGLA